MNNIFNYEDYIQESYNNKVPGGVKDSNGRNIRTGNFIDFVKGGKKYRGKVLGIGISDDKRKHVDSRNNLRVLIIQPRNLEGEKIEVEPEDAQVYM